jgi:hypothetical protein
VREREREAGKKGDREKERESQRQEKQSKDRCMEERKEGWPDNVASTLFLFFLPLLLHFFFHLFGSPSTFFFFSLSLGKKAREKESENEWKN